MQTEALSGAAGVDRAAALLRAGRLVAFPTETVYGLGANALDPEAVRRIFAAKGRPSDNPLIVHIAGRAGLDEAADLSAPGLERRLVDELAERFWPGPLTLVLPARPSVPREVTAGLDTVGVRVPAHPLALALLRAAGVPVAAPSANRSGRPSPTRAEHVWADLGGRIDAILDGGATDVGVESTVLDLSRRPYAILRPGGVAAEQLCPYCGPLAPSDTVVSREVGADEPCDTAVAEPPRSPGLKYAHYAPRAPLTLVEGDPATVRRRIVELVDAAVLRGQRVGVLVAEEDRERYPRAVVAVSPGRRGDLAAWANRLYDCLRQFDQVELDLVVAEGVMEEGLGSAIADRLRRAAGGRVERV